LALQVFDVDVTQLRVEEGHQLFAADHPAAQAKVQQGEHFAAGQGADPLLEPVKPARGMDPTDQRTDGRAGDDVGTDARLLQCADHADVGPAPGRASAKCKTDAGWPAGHWPRLRPGCAEVPGAVISAATSRATSSGSRPPWRTLWWPGPNTPQSAGSVPSNRPIERGADALARCMIPQSALT